MRRGGVAEIMECRMSCKNESWWVALILSVFFLVNLFTAHLSPVPWYDEVFYVSPGLNLYLGEGFVSNAWPFQSGHDFWSCYVPLYPLLLSVWLKIFGFSLTTIRSMGYFFAALAGFFLWLSSLRFGWFKDTRGRLTLLVLALCGHGATISYRSGRQDALAILLAAALLCSFSIKNKYGRFISIFVLAFICPWVQLPLVLYGIFIAVLFFFYFKKAFLDEFIMMGLGFFSGIPWMLAFFGWHDAMDAFLAYNKQYVFFGQTWQEKQRLLVIQNASVGAIFLFIVALFLLWKAGRYLTSQQKTRLRFAGTVFLLFPLIMWLVWDFHVQYSWTISLPLRICVIMALFSADFSLGAKQKKILLAAIISFVLIAGLPARLALILYQYEARDYRMVETFIKKHVKKEDVVYCGFLPYYAVKAITPHVFLWTYSTFTEKDKKDVSIVIIRPDSIADYKGDIGGEWFLQDTLDSNPNHKGEIGFGRWKIKPPKNDLEVYRRTPRGVET